MTGASAAIIMCSALPRIILSRREHGPGTAFVSLYGSNSWDINLAKLLISKGAKPAQADIDTLREIKERNSWLKNTDEIISVLKIAIAENGIDTEPSSVKTMKVRSNNKSTNFIPNGKNGKIDSGFSRDPY